MGEKSRSQGRRSRSDRCPEEEKAKSHVCTGSLPHHPKPPVPTFLSLNVLLFCLTEVRENRRWREMSCPQRPPVVLSRFFLPLPEKSCLSRAHTEGNIIEVQRSTQFYHRGIVKAVIWWYLGRGCHAMAGHSMEPFMFRHAISVRT